MIKYFKKNPHFFFLYIVTLLVCFLVFKQNDLTHTYTSSYAFLDGHFYDFYDYNKRYMMGNDYLPLIYVFFALWNLPLKIMGLLTPADTGLAVWQISTPIEIFWSKLLIAIFFVGCIALIGKISELLGLNKENGTVSPQMLFATSPIAIFAVFIFSQYDIFGVFFTLLGIYFYLQKKFFHFAIYFSTAISFKYFACFVYLPLVLLVEKRLLHIVKYGLIGSMVTALQIIAYWHSEIFQDSYFALAGNKTGEAILRGKAIYMILLYVALCCYAYFYKFKLTQQKKDWALNVILVCTLAYSLMFSFVKWHPQWILILIPFFALTVSFIRNKQAFLSLELIAYAAFIWLCVNGWAKNVDVTMAQEGILREYIPTLSYYGADILPPQGNALARIVFNVYLFSPFIFIAFESKEIIKAKVKKWLIKNSVLQRFECAYLNSAEGKQNIEAKFETTYLARIIMAGYCFLLLYSICLCMSLFPNFFLQSTPY